MRISVLFNKFLHRVTNIHAWLSYIFYNNSTHPDSNIIANGYFLPYICIGAKINVIPKSAYSTNTNIRSCCKVITYNTIMTNCSMQIQMCMFSILILQVNMLPAVMMLPSPISTHSEITALG